jgi:hypothetical protein
MQDNDGDVFRRIRLSISDQATECGMPGSMASSQRLFFHFTTDDGSQTGHDAETDLDNLDDPHLRQSQGRTQPWKIQDEDEDPYLRLDEDERWLELSRYESYTVRSFSYLCSILLLQTPYPSSCYHPTSVPTPMSVLRNNVRCGPHV